MIEGRNIICFASGWNYHPTSKHHIMRALSEKNNVIWVNWHASRRPQINLSDGCAIVRKLWQIGRGAQSASSSITTLTPLQIPLPSSPMANRFNTWSVQRAVNKVLDRLPAWPMQLWSFAPDVDKLVGCFNEELALYYCVDAFGEFTGFDADLIAAREQSLMNKCDIVLATSPPLYESKRQQHANVHSIQHGVNHGHLAQAVTEDLPVPKELRDLQGPILGFVGVLGDWVDMELIAGLAKERPDASIVLIGPEMTSRGSCAGLKNIHWLGGRNHTELPQYLRHFDVSLIPFKKVPLTYNANPIKLYEYLAAGVPVVTTSLPVIHPIDRAVWIADDPKTTAACCREAEQLNSFDERMARCKMMTAEAWPARLEQISRLIDETVFDASGQPKDRPCSDMLREVRESSLATA